MTTHELSALTGAYAVDALDEVERARFEAHLADCAECAAEVRSLRAAAAELSRTTVSAAPPGLRADVLAAIGQVRPLPPVSGTVTPPRPRPARPWLWQAAAAAAACLVIAIAAGSWGYQQHRAADRHRTQASAITAVLDSPDASTVTGRVGSTGHATVVYSEREHRLVLIGHDIPAPARDKTYQLWMISPHGHATSAGLFTPDSSGNVVVQARGNLSDTASMGISEEPAGGSEQPTPGAVLAVMKV